MSGYLWKAFLEDDVRTFRAVLESASYVARGGNQKGNHGGQHMTATSIGSPGSLIHKGNEAFLPSNIVLTRADLNFRDGQGRTLLHLIATSKSENAIEFARVLLEQPLVDIYIQDFESGYTGLHRAFYHGNISVAIVILNRDISDALGGSHSSLHHPGGLIRIKDHEGNGPFDVLEQTLESTRLHRTPTNNEDTSTDSDSEAEGRQAQNPWNRVFETEARRFNGFKSLDAHEVYTFGSNKNITLGFGDEDDRQFPERVTVRFPDHLVENHLEEYRSEHASHATAKSLPPWVRYKPTLIHNVVMGRFSTAILTNDSVSNLHICGHGSGGRLGLGDERTRFHFTCVDTGSLAQKKIVAVALGHHHTLALSEEGEVFSWGSNTYGQLGYSLPLSKNKEPVQLTPRQIFGTIKREPVCGIAASGNHSVVHTLDSLYTFGKNEGQLGIVDSDARSLEMQNIPRKVGGVKFSHSIVSVSAIENATVCLLSSRDVWVFANYGYSKITFPPTSPSNWFRSSKAEMQNLGTWNFNFTPVTKIASSGDSICALTTDGQIYSFNVAKPNTSAQSMSSSTTNPSKIRAALSTPQIVWSNRKTRLGAHDMAVDQNGSIIVVTNAGSVWKRVKRAKIKDASASGISEYKAKDYKFSRVPGLTSVIGVRSSGSGGYAVLRKEKRYELPDVPSSIEKDLLKISGFPTFAPPRDASGGPLEWIEIPSYDEKLTKYLAHFTGGPDGAIKEIFKTKTLGGALDPTVILCSDTSACEIPIHAFLLGAASPHLKALFSEEHAEDTILNNLATVHREVDCVKVLFRGVDILTLFTLLYYTITGTVLPLHRCAASSLLANRFRKSRAELTRLSQQLEIEGLEDVLKNRASYRLGRQTIMRKYYSTRSFDSYAIGRVDAVVQLADDEIPVHAALICQRCPFFSGLFAGRAQGRWLAGRQVEGELIKVNLSHINAAGFDIVLKWIYTDSLEAFSDLQTENLDDYLDKLLEVLSIANELMIKPLSLHCQRMIGAHVTVRNVGAILNAIAPCEVTDLKDSCLKYMLENLEAAMRHGQCDELDDELFLELDSTARSIQRTRSWIARDGTLDEELFERHPELKERIALALQSKIDSIVLLNKYSVSQSNGASSFRAGSFNRYSNEPLPKPPRRRSSNHGSLSPSSTPIMKGGQHPELIFDMDEEEELSPLSTPSKLGGLPAALARISLPSPEMSVNRVGKQRAASEAKSELFDHDTPLTSFEASKIETSPMTWPSPSTLSAPKLSMKDIMNQASTARPSNLSLGLSEKRLSSAGNSTTSIAHAKLSQKERKKQQQQAALNVLEPPPSPQALRSPSGMAVSPWKNIPKPKAKAIEQVSPIQSVGKSTPQLTMRQTISNPSASTPVKQPPSRSVTDSPQARPAPPSSATPSSIPIIKSIRHIPMEPKRSLSNQHTPLNEILSQQAAEKMIAQGGGPKRSIADIQAEQEFQEWWDKESERAQAEEKARNEPPKPKEKRRGHRPDRRRRGGDQKIPLSKGSGSSSKQ